MRSCFARVAATVGAVSVIAGCGGGGHHYSAQPLRSCLDEQGATTWSLSAIKWGGQDFFKAVAPSSIGVRFSSTEEVVVAFAADKTRASRISDEIEKLHSADPTARIEKTGNVVLLLPASLSKGSRDTINGCLKQATST